MSEPPNGWVLTRTGDLGTLHCGQSPPSASVNHSGHGQMYVTGPEQWDGKEVLRTKWTTEPKRVVPEGCIFITVKGAGVGKLFLGVACAIGRDIYAFEPKPGVSRRFVEKALRFSIDDVLRHARGTIPGLSRSHILDHEIGLPPLAQQRAIVDRIEALTAKSRRAKEALDAIPPLLERFRQSVLAAAFRGDLTRDWREQHPDVEPAEELLARIRRERRRRWEEAELEKLRAKGKEPKNDKWKEKYKEPEPVDAEGLPELPEGWCWASLGEMFHVGVGATPSRKEPAFWGGEIPWISSGEVAFRRIADSKERITGSGLQNTSTELHPPGTVLLGMIGEGKTRGQAAILDVPACNNQNSAAIRVSEAGLPPEYVYHYLRLTYALTRSIGSGNNQPALNKSRVAAMALPVAPLAEQRAVARYVESVEEYVGRLASVRLVAGASLRTLDAAVLARAFRGEL